METIKKWNFLRKKGSKGNVKNLGAKKFTHCLDPRCAVDYVLGMYWRDGRMHLGKCHLGPCKR